MHTAQCNGITNTYLSHKNTIVRIIHVSKHRDTKIFLDYIKLSSDELKIGKYFRILPI